MTLDLSSLVQAVDSLRDSLEVLRLEQAGNNPQVLRVIQAGVIQNFEFTFELSHKMLKRYLEATEPNPAGLDQANFQDLIRLGSERGLLRSSWDSWKRYRTARGITSHTYDQTKAQEVLALVPEFLLEAQILLGQLEQRSRETSP